LKEGQVPAILDSQGQQFFSDFHSLGISKTQTGIEKLTNMAGEKTPHFDTLQLHAGKED